MTTKPVKKKVDKPVMRDPNTLQVSARRRVANAVKYGNVGLGGRAALRKSFMNAFAVVQTPCVSSYIVKIKVEAVR